jgi:hypothetical protein
VEEGVVVPEVERPEVVGPVTVEGTAPSAGVEDAAGSSDVVASAGRLAEGVVGLGAAEVALWPAINNWSALSPPVQRGGVALALPPGAGVAAPVVPSFVVTLLVNVGVGKVAGSFLSASEKEEVSS